MNAWVRKKREEKKEERSRDGSAHCGQEGRESILKSSMSKIRSGKRSRKGKPSRFLEREWFSQRKEIKNPQRFAEAHLT